MYLYHNELYYSATDQRQHHHRTSYDVVVVHIRTPLSRSMNNALGLGVYGYCSGNALYVCSVWKKLKHWKRMWKEDICVFGCFFCNDKKPISFGTVCDINQMGAAAVKPLQKRLSWRQYRRCKAIVPVAERDSCAEIIFSEQLSFVCQCGGSYMLMLCADDCGMVIFYWQVFLELEKWSVAIYFLSCHQT